MLNVGLIGYGAIAQYVVDALPRIDGKLACVIARPGRARAVAEVFGPDVPVLQTLGAHRPDVVVDCAGHAGLAQHGAEILMAGVDLLTVSIGALADDTLTKRLSEAARQGGSRLYLCSGAIGGLDALAAAGIGQLDTVTYTGRKPPQGWIGSRAEEVVDLDAPGRDPVTHFTGSARDAARLYPKNANVAAAVAFAGLGMDRTTVALVCDPGIERNIHEIDASGAFGEFRFTIEGNTLEANPRTSALAAMSVVKRLADMTAWIRL